MVQWLRYGITYIKRLFLLVWMWFSSEAVVDWVKNNTRTRKRSNLYVVRRGVPQFSFLRARQSRIHSFILVVTSFGGRGTTQNGSLTLFLEAKGLRPLFLPAHPTLAVLMRRPIWPWVFKATFCEGGRPIPAMREMRPVAHSPGFRKHMFSLF